MILFEELIEGKTDSEVKAMYIRLMQQGSRDEGRMVRTAFLRKKALSRSLIEWDEVMQYMLVAEKNDYILLNDRKIGKEIGQGFEFEGEDLPISRMTAFLMASLANAVPNRFDSKEIGFIFFRESNLLTEQPDKQFFMFYLLDAYLNRANSLAAEKLADVIQHTNPIFKGLGAEMKMKGKRFFDITTFEESFKAELFPKQSDVRILEKEFNYLRHGALFMLIYYMNKGQDKKALQWLEEALHITDSTDYVYDTLLLIQKQYHEFDY